MSQAFNSRFGWRRVCGVLVFAVLIFASLFLPPQLETMRTGHWELEHFLAYLAAVPMICLGWPRPFLVAAALIPSAAVLEALQCLMPDHSPNILAALGSIGGIGVGALIAVVMIRALERQAFKRTNVGPIAQSNRYGGELGHASHGVVLRTSADIKFFAPAGPPLPRRIAFL